MDSFERKKARITVIVDLGNNYCKIQHIEIPYNVKYIGAYHLLVKEGIEKAIEQYPELEKKIDRD